MAKKIFLSEDEVNSFLRDAQEKLIEECQSIRKRKFQNERDKEITIGFKMLEVKDDRKANLLFSAKSWTKMYSLINTFTTEVEWHGLVQRLDETTFFVSDILVFPHTVTGSTVTSDQNEYEAWLDTLDDDTFNALRFHGHSHVNMGVTPSGVDMEYRKNVLNNFGMPNQTSDYFYIFLIGNKNGLTSAEIYDLQNNALYGTSEINISVDLGGGEHLYSFLTYAKEVVKELHPTYNSYGKSYGKSCGIGDRVVDNGCNTKPLNYPKNKTSNKKKKAWQERLWEDDYDYSDRDELYSWER